MNNKKKNGGKEGKVRYVKPEKKKRKRAHKSDRIHRDYGRQEATT